MWDWISDEKRSWTKVFWRWRSVLRAVRGQLGKNTQVSYHLITYLWFIIYIIHTFCPKILLNSFKYVRIKSFLKNSMEIFANRHPLKISITVVLGLHSMKADWPTVDVCSRVKTTSSAVMPAKLSHLSHLDRSDQTTGKVQDRD